MNPQQEHELYLQQQQYYAQFQQQNQIIHQQQLDYLNQMGFTEHGKNIGLLRRCNGNLEQVIYILTNKQQQHHTHHHHGYHQQYHTHRQPRDNTHIDELQIVKTTQLLVLDCNNMKYAHKRWNKFQHKPQKQLKKTFKKILKWSTMEHNILQEVQVMWDVFNFKCLQQKFKSKKRPKIGNSVKSLIGQMIPQLEQPRIEILMDNPVSQQQIKIIIQQSHPLKADDVIVSMLAGQHNEMTTMVTSDQGLRMRLNEIGVTQYIGSGEWWKFGKQCINK